MEEADPQMEEEAPQISPAAKESIAFPVVEEEPGEPSRLDAEREKHRQRWGRELLQGDSGGNCPLMPSAAPMSALKRGLLPV